MQPYMDKEDNELGIALFFSVLFDKLIISKYLNNARAPRVTDLTISS